MIAPVNMKSMGKSGGSAVSGGLNDGRAVLKDAQNATRIEQREAAITADLVADAPSMTGTALGVADKVTEVAGFLPILAGVSGFILGSVPKKIGEWTGFKGLEKVGTRIKDFHETVHEVNFAQVGDKLHIRKPVAAAADASFGVVGTTTSWLSNKTGWGKWRGEVNAGKVAGRFADAQAALGKFNVSELNHTELEKHVGIIRDALNGTHVPSTVPVPASVSAGISGAVSHGGGHIPSAGTLHAGHPHFDAIKTSFEKIHEIKAEKGFKLTAGKGATKEFEGFLKNVGKGIGHHESISFWHNPRQAFKEMPKKIGQSSAMEGVMHGSFIVGSGVSMATDAHGFLGNWKKLKQMHADMTGAKASDVSTFSLIFGDNSDAVRTEKWRLLKSLFVSETADAVGMGVNIVGAAKGSRWGFLKSSIAYMLPGMVSGAYTSSLGESSLPVYNQLTKLHKAHHAIPVEGYAALLTATSKELASRGNQFTQAIAKQYAAEKIAPSEVLRRVESGKVMADVHALIAAHEAEKHHPANQANGSHVARVQGQAPQANRQTVGGHTKRIVDKASMAAEAGILGAGIVSDL